MNCFSCGKEIEDINEIGESSECPYCLTEHYLTYDEEGNPMIEFYKD